MLRHRISVSLLLLPILLWIISSGSWLYQASVSVILALAAAEYGLLFRRAGLRPSLPVLIFGVLALGLGRASFSLEGLGLALAAGVMISMIWHAIDYERGAPQSGSDFAVTLSGILYLGWFGGYLIALRELPEGQWWVMLALPSVWVADSAAYFVGQAFGRHKLSPRLSPKKTWEGYLAGVIFGALAGVGLAALWRVGAGPDTGIGPLSGGLMAASIAILSPFGDLGVSMLKRQMGVKDSGSFLTGHGGALDRLDSWLWAGALGFYAVRWLT